MLASSFKLFAAVAVGITMFAAPVTSTTYARFCADQHCTLDCGGSVSVDNPACLTLSGRNSVKFHDLNAQQIQLITSPDKHCSCQNYCYTRMLVEPFPYSPGGCRALSGPTAQSYRFVGTAADCARNQC